MAICGQNVLVVVIWFKICPKTYLIIFLSAHSIITSKIAFSVSKVGKIKESVENLHDFEITEKFSGQIKTRIYLKYNNKIILVLILNNFGCSTPINTIQCVYGNITIDFNRNFIRKTLNGVYLGRTPEIV